MVEEQPDFLLQAMVSQRFRLTGSFCPVNATSPLRACPAGYVCPSEGVRKPCPVGRYCPGSDVKGRRCPWLTSCNQEGNQHPPWSWWALLVSLLGLGFLMGLLDLYRWKGRAKLRRLMLQEEGRQLARMVGYRLGADPAKKHLVLIPKAAGPGVGGSSGGPGGGLLHQDSRAWELDLIKVARSATSKLVGTWRPPQGLPAVSNRRGEGGPPDTAAAATAAAAAAAPGTGGSRGLAGGFHHEEHSGGGGPVGEGTEEEVFHELPSTTNSTPFASPTTPHLQQQQGGQEQPGHMPPATSFITHGSAGLPAGRGAVPKLGAGRGRRREGGAAVWPRVSLVFGDREPLQLQLPGSRGHANVLRVSGRGRGGEGRERPGGRVAGWVGEWVGGVMVVGDGKKEREGLGCRLGGRG